MTADGDPATCVLLAAWCLQRLEALVQEVEPDIYTPDFVAEEVSSTQQAVRVQTATPSRSKTALPLTHLRAPQGMSGSCTSL
jgi:hypothetical protein